MANVNSFDDETKDYEISVNPSQLQDFSLMPLDVYQAVQRTNVNVGGDVTNSGQHNCMVRDIGLLNNIGDTNNTVTENVSGTPILINDVAIVYDSVLPRLG